MVVVDAQLCKFTNIFFNCTLKMNEFCGIFEIYLNKDIKKKSRKKDKTWSEGSDNTFRTRAEGDNKSWGSRLICVWALDGCLPLGPRGNI